MVIIWDDEPVKDTHRVSLSPIRTKTKSSIHTVPVHFVAHTYYLFSAQTETEPNTESNHKPTQIT